MSVTTWLAVGSLGAVVGATFWAILREGYTDKRPWTSDPEADEAEGSHGHGSSRSGDKHEPDSSDAGGADGDGD